MVEQIKKNDRHARFKQMQKLIAVAIHIIVVEMYQRDQDQSQIQILFLFRSITNKVCCNLM